MRQNHLTQNRPLMGKSRRHRVLRAQLKKAVRERRPVEYMRNILDKATVPIKDMHLFRSIPLITFVNDVDVVRLLLEYGASPDMFQTKSTWDRRHQLSPLHSAFLMGSLPLMKLFVEYGCVCIRPFRSFGDELDEATYKMKPLERNMLVRYAVKHLCPAVLFNRSTLNSYRFKSEIRYIRMRAIRRIVNNMENEVRMTLLVISLQRRRITKWSTFDPNILGIILSLLDNRKIRFCT